MRKLLLMFAVPLIAASPEVVERARGLYEKTEYHASLRLLEGDPAPDADTFALIGQNYFMLENYGKATQALEKACEFAPKVFAYHLWLGRAYGRRAERDGWFSAASHASKARQALETAVALAPNDIDALNDLFDYYLGAPGVLGGGVDKAEALAKRFERDRPDEYQHEMALLADHKKQFPEALAHLKKAWELAPNDLGRALDVARYQAKLGQVDESEATFVQAEARWPGDRRLAFDHGKFYVEHHREPQRARRLLEGYLHAELRPDDPPKREAEALLRRLPAP
jgi:Tfp pilus assembly protein PilF